MSSPAFHADHPFDTNPAATLTHRKLSGFLAWCPFLATASQVVPCTFFIALSGYRIAIGGLAVFAATCIGPFERFHQDSIRIPFYVLAASLSLLNLAMYVYARHRRNAPAARWRMHPLTTRERRVQWIQLTSSVLTLLMIVGDIVNHRVHGF